jgi:hypothetical protein
MDELQLLKDAESGGQTLESWVVQKCSEWRDSLEANYFNKWDEYYRIWRGIWAEEDKTRDSERSKLISPATQQAVESSVSDLEEATFGRGSFFDMDEEIPEQAANVEQIKRELAKKFRKHGIRRDTSEVLINGAVFGTGIAEIVVDSYTEYTPAEQEDEDGLRVIGRNQSEEICVKLRPIKPHNFRIPDTATCIEDALGVGIEEYVAPDYVYDLQESGVYMQTDALLHDYSSDDDIEADPTIDTVNEPRIKLLRYYGKVPRHLLEDTPDFKATQNHSESYYTEAVVVIANDGVLLKAIDNPYLMNDRPVVAFQWDIVPGRFWGRGVCEKGYNPQKALDAELRQRRDAMAMNVAPMLGIDATRLPMLGQKLRVSPGKQILVNGDPREILHPFRFGDLPQTSFVETEGLSKMVQMATGAVDSAGIAGQVNGEATAAGISMSLGAIIKRQKRTLINFQESFLIPFVRKAAYRYMQYVPDVFPQINDYDFIVTSSLGIMAREYEVGQLTQLLQTMSPDSPLYSALIKSIIDNMNLSNREELIAQLEQANQPNEQQIAAQQAQELRAQQQHDMQLRVLEAQAKEFEARAHKYNVEASLGPAKLEVERMEAAADINNDAADDFERVMRLSDTAHQRRMDEAEFRLKEAMANKPEPQPQQPQQTPQTEQQ